MATLQARKLREVNPDQVLFTLGDMTTGLRDTLTFSRTLPKDLRGTPTVKGGVTATKEFEIKDSTGTVTHTQLATCTVRFTFPTKVSKEAADAVVDRAITALKSQYASLAEGLLPDQGFSAEIDESITVR